MVAHVQKIAEGYAVVLTEDALRELKLVEGSAVEITAAQAAATGARPQIGYASVEEVLRIHRKLEPRNASAYRELAK